MDMQACPLGSLPAGIKSQDSQCCLHKKTHRRNPHPAAESHKDRPASGFYQLYQICIESDSRHSHDNEKLTQLFNRRCYGTWKRKYCSDHRGQDKKQDKKGENLFYLKGSPGFLPCCLCFSHLPESQDQRNGNDRQSPGQLHDSCRVQGIASVYAVPRRSRCSYRRSVIYSGSCKKAEPLIAQSQDSSQRRKDQDSEIARKERSQKLPGRSPHHLRRSPEP